MSNEKEYLLVQEAWADPERHIHGSGSLLRAVSSYLELGLVDCAYAIATHAAEIQTSDDPFNFEEKNWTEIYLEVFRRAFYDIREAAKYGTLHIAENPELLKTVSMELIGQADAVQLPNETLDTTNLPANVSLFPILKTRQ